MPPDNSNEVDLTIINRLKNTEILSLYHIPLYVQILYQVSPIFPFPAKFSSDGPKICHAKGSSLGFNR